ncbi:MAG: YdjY domain-containing protein, partial [Isosphaeraceae bacterium]
MKKFTTIRFLLGLVLLACLSINTSGQQNKPNDPPPPEAEKSWKPLGKDLWFDPARRELVILSQVVLREGPLEHLLCLKGTKEHESILATSAEARAIHAGLLLTKAVPDHPVRFQPKFEPPAGSKIQIELKWLDDKKKPQKALARNMVRNFKTNKPIEIDWVFGGSLIVEDPRTKKPFYAATEGDYFTVANFASAILDLPVPSSA